MAPFGDEGSQTLKLTSKCEEEVAATMKLTSKLAAMKFTPTPMQRNQQNAEKGVKDAIQSNTWPGTVSVLVGPKRRKLWPTMCTTITEEAS